MIFATLGTHHQAFPRFVSALERLGGERLVVQYGHSRAPAGAAEAAPFMPFDAIVARMREADVVITHAGVGSILLAIRNGHTPIVVPRRRAFGEHVDDHQVELTEALAAAGRVVPAWDLGDLRALVAAARPHPEPEAAPQDRLVRAVREALR